MHCPLKHTMYLWNKYIIYASIYISLTENPNTKAGENQLFWINLHLTWKDWSNGCCQKLSSIQIQGKKKKPPQKPPTKKTPNPKTKPLLEDITSPLSMLNFQLRWTIANWLVNSLLWSYQPRMKKLQVTCPWDKFCTMSFQCPYPLIFQKKI